MYLSSTQKIQKATTVEGVTPLLVAAYKGCVDVVRHLLAAGATTKAGGRTAQGLASANGHTEVIRLLSP